MNADIAIADEARLWVIRAHDPAFTGWDEFTGWLERDARHLAAYEAALDDDSAMAGLLASTPVVRGAARPARVMTAHIPRRRALFAIAASVVAVVGAWAIFQPGGGEEIITAPGERRTVQLADGSRIILNGGTRIVLDPGEARHVELAAGEALFEVRHDASDPFVVMVGDTQLLDAGTVFNVQSENGTIDVAVAHGAVIYQPGKKQIRLDAGSALHRQDADGQPVLRKAQPQAIGSWQAGILHYDNAPLDVVARDIGRNVGVTIGLGAGAEKMRFNGTLAVGGPSAEVLARIGPLLGVSFTPDGSAWIMTPANGSPR